MRLSRFGFLCVAITAIVGCSSEDITNNRLPDLAGVRYINALADTGLVDVRMVDQVEWSANANGLNFRQGIEHQPTEAKERHIRVFSFASMNVGVVSQVIVDTTITFAANSKATLLLIGSARARTARFVVIDDAPPPAAANQIAVRAVNASTGAIDAYVVTFPGDPIAGSPTAANIAINTASPYITRATGVVALKVTDAGSTTANASAAGPPAAAPPAGTPFFPSAGIDTGGSAFSVYYFPRGVAGSAQNAIITPGIIWFVDRVPTS
jgi:uncharacterized protein DUF4397